MVNEVTEDDIVLDVLLTLRVEHQAPISERLVRGIYEIQRLHQFDLERDKVVVGIRRAVEAEIDEQGGS